MTYGRLDATLDAIKQTVSARDAAEALGLECDRHGRCACPFHNGTDRNLKLYAGDRGYYCFVCHAHGDVISLVRGVTGGTFTDAVNWLCEAFHIENGLNTAPDPERLAEARRAAQERRAERERKKEMDRIAFEMYLAAGDLTRELEKQRDTYAPKGPDEPWHPKFREAVEELAKARELADRLSLEVVTDGREFGG